ncbi:MAG: Ig-like domain-containing protein [Candidatus Poribacteria bacterium]|nr:Ig-like domain-containing protein [Candidatus Poribacteria bacterium]
MNRETLISIITTVILLTSIIFASCGVSIDNAQPEINSIDDQTIEINDTRRIPVNITDADMDDTHIINVSSDNPRVADVSVDADSLIIIANTAGIATITVTATDSSTQDNAISMPVTFQVTVNAPLINKGMCVVGMTLQPGESCTYAVDQVPITFYVNQDNQGCRKTDHTYTTEIFGLPVTIKVEFVCADEDITGEEINISGDNPFDRDFHANKNRDGSWTIDKIP